MAQLARQASWNEAGEAAVVRPLRRFLFAVPPAPRQDTTYPLRCRWEYDPAKKCLVQIWRREP